MYIKFGKRIIDILLCFIGMPLFGLVFVVFAPLIWLTDRGPVFYVADRLGYKGTVFRMYKFRSMKINSPDLRNNDGSTYNSYDDPRLTPIGRIMRKLSIDEIPQVINVLKGDMSIIGPRPFIPADNMSNQTNDFYTRLNVKPGITGYAQAYYRNSIQQDEKIKLDAEYANNVSLMLDLRILIKTIETVILRKNIFNH